MKTQKKIKIIAVVVILIIVSIIYLSTNTKSNSDTIKIGAIVPQTGFGAYWGKPVMIGLELAQDEFNRKYGLNKIKIITEDSQSNSAKAVSAAQKLVSIDKVDALYSEFSSLSTAVAPVANSASKIFVHSTFSTTVKNRYGNSVKTFINFDTACEELVRLDNNKNNKFLIISALSDTAPACVNGLKTVIPEENIKVVDGFVGEDFRTLLLQNKEFNPDYIIPIMYENGSYPLLKQINDINMDVIVYSDKQDLATEKILTSLPYSATNRIKFFESVIDEGFINKIKNKYPDIKNDDIQAAANSYQSMIILSEGLLDCENNRTSSCVYPKIANKNTFSSVGYKNIKTEDGILISDLSIGFVENGKIRVIK